jgi:DNA repair ATPase RecN
LKELGIKLKIDGDISNILDSLKHLKNAFDDVEMPDKMTKDLVKSIDTAIQKVGEFGRKSESAIDSLSDSKEVSNAWKSVEKILDALQVKLGNVDATKLFPKEVIENLEKAEASAKEYNRALTEAKGLDAYKSKLEELN